MTTIVSTLIGLAVIMGCGKPTVEPETPRPRAVRAPERQPALPPEPEVSVVAVEPELATEPTVLESSTPALVQEEAPPPQQEPSGPGIAYKNDWIRRVPWSVNLIKMERSRTDLDLTTTMGRGRIMGLSALSEQLAAIPSELGEPVAAVNGDFYQTEHDTYAGDPRGLQILRGEFVSAPTGKTAFWIDPEGNPVIGDVASQMKVIWPEGETTSIGLNEARSSREAVLYTPRLGSSTRASGGRELVLMRSGDSPWLPLRAGEFYTAQVKEVREAGNSRLRGEVMVLSLGPSLAAKVPRVEAGAIIQISTATSPDLRGVQTAIGGGPVLIRDGKVQPARVPKSNERHPRTAMGWNDTHFYLVQVDGRQHGFSMGMTLPELANYMAKEGCRHAMNLDGGGSSEMWVEGEIVNRPCFGYERSTANGLVIVRKRKLAGR